MTTVTKQEEIEEGLTKLFRKFEAESPDAGYGYEYEEWIPIILQYLHDNGVVRKVDYYVSGTEVNCPNCHRAFLDKVEPLIAPEAKE